MDFPAPERTGRRRQRWRPAVLAALAAVIVMTMAGAGSAAAATGVNAWGAGGLGQLGNGKPNPEKLPGPVHELSEVSAVSAGSEWGLALMNNTEKTVKAWGNNFGGYLGDGTTIGKLVPVEVGGPQPTEKLSKVGAVSAGGEFNLALTENGTEKKVMAWGLDEWGQLGNGVKGAGQKSDVPVEVKGFPAGSTVKAVAAGYKHALALLENTEKQTSVWAWGLNEFGALGQGNNTGPEKCVVAEVEGKKEEFGCSSKPVEVKGLTGLTITGIAAGFEFSTALTSAGAVRAWGDHEFGQLGNGETRPECKTLECPKEFKTEPQVVHGEGGTGELTGVGKISAGGFHVLALMNNTEKTVKAWGANEMGQLGNGTTTTSPNPVTVKELNGVSSVAAGFTHSLALTSNGKVWAWGDNKSGELGNGSEVNSDVPVEVKQGLGEVTGISDATEFSLSTGAAAPTVTGVKPKTGAEVGNSPVMIAGTNFSGATAVKFGTANALSFKELSATSIEATSPAETEKVSPADVTVTTPAMISRTNEKDRFFYRAAGLNATDWAVNFKPVSTTQSPVESWGTLTFENTFDHSLVGKLTCHTLMGGGVFNEGEAGFGKVEGFGTFGCVKEPKACPGAFMTAEEENKLVNTVQGTEKITVAKHGLSLLPWEAEMYETENTEKKQKFLKDKIVNMALTLVLPCEPLAGEYRFKGTLEPIVVNGAANGLSGSHLKFEGKGGQTGHLTAITFPTLLESEKEMPVSGEMTMEGNQQQLITAE